MTNTVPVSAMYVADPTLWLGDKMQLSWYTGWEGFDAQKAISRWVLKAARSIGASRILLTGSSGGGFAALQVSALIPGSIALPFNSQTSIHKYRVNGLPWAQKHYLQVVWPECAPQGVDSVNFDNDWTLQLDDRVSTLRRYAQPLGNYVFFVINRNEDHYEAHYLPWLAAAAKGNNLCRVRVEEYQGGPSHNPPTQDVFFDCLARSLSWATELPSVPALALRN
ncbi:MAG: hypothetical protein Q4F67_13965 [Propionibacteriaceae bacterium]|nr:hypothetical protein [Propionibacteriaceae bacterium]